MTYYDLKFTDAVRRANEHEYALLKDRVVETGKVTFKYPHYFEVNDTKDIKNYVDWCIKKDLLVQDKKGNLF
ncbi:hypothetical protein [Salipaludibacillus sp. CF4.18]|uniref:hypothetical protein n=1 Tax=Salipaludibacillus sp. CF4.18 TaxID=3373081 RepID=UPI003EE52BFF